MEEELATATNSCPCCSWVCSGRRPAASLPSSMRPLPLELCLPQKGFFPNSYRNLLSFPVPGLSLLVPSKRVLWRWSCLALLTELGVRLQDKGHSGPGPGSACRNSAPQEAMSFRGCALPTIQMGKLRITRRKDWLNILSLHSLGPFMFSTFPWEIFLGS